MYGRSFTAAEVIKNFAGGSVEMEGQEQIEVPDPVTGEVLGQVSRLGTEDAERAVRAARETFEE